MVHELAVEVLIQSVLRSSSIIRHQFYRRELGIEESRMVATKLTLSHKPTQHLRDTDFADEAVFLAIGLDSSHPIYCLSHNFIFSSF